MLGIPPSHLEMDLCHNSKAKENSRVVSQNEVVARAQSRTPSDIVTRLYIFSRVTFNISRFSYDSRILKENLKKIFYCNCPKFYYLTETCHHHVRI